MKKITLIVLCLLASMSISTACDVCGCKLGGLNFGILPQYSNHFVGVRYSHAHFNAAMRYNSDYLEDETSNDTYQKIELMGRYVINKKFQVNVVLPYLINEMEGSHQNVKSNGLGDPSLLLYYQPFNNWASITAKWKHALLIGAGLKFPLGKHDEQDQGEIINRNFQVGSGSLDYLVSMNYTIRKNAIGFNVESGYKINTENEDGYEFGNQLNLSGYTFYLKEFSWLSVLPYGGVYFEHGQKHLSNGFEQVNTGGQATFASAGLQFYKGSMTLNLIYQTPLSQSFNADNVSLIESGDRFSIGFMINIAKKGNGAFIPVE